MDWSEFERWVRREYAPRTAYSRVQYARRYAHLLFSGDLSELLAMSADKRGHVLKALSCLSKFLGMYDTFIELVKRHGLKWSVRNDDLLIKRFTKVTDPESLFVLIKDAKIRNPDLADFIDFIALSGLRLSEAVESYNLIIKLSSEGRLHEYYDSKREVLEHFKFKEIFIRRSKKAFITFMPSDAVMKISGNKPVNMYSIQTRIKRSASKLKFGDIRELHATLLTKYLRDVEIDFLHGRISSSVFMRNYFNPAWIADLKERVFKAIAEIKEKISIS
ncbi:MAG: integrase [Candidatus Bathyarchaeia archaeon]